MVLGWQVFHFLRNWQTDILLIFKGAVENLVDHEAPSVVEDGAADEEEAEVERMVGVGGVLDLAIEDFSEAVLLEEGVGSEGEELEEGPEGFEEGELGEEAAEGEGEEEDGVGDGVVGECLEFVSGEVDAEGVEEYGGEGGCEEGCVFCWFCFVEGGEYGDCLKGY
jgi:hypothetical protein